MINEAQTAAIRRVQSMINVAAGNTNKTRGMLESILEAMEPEAKERPLLERAVQVLGAVDKIEGASAIWLQAVIRDSDYPE